MKRGFGLVSAMIFIVVLATIGALALAMSTKSVGQATNTYLKEQAEVLATNATEFAVMAMQMHDYDANRNCLNDITIFYPNQANAVFRMDVELSYLNSSLYNGCRISNTASALGLTHPAAHAAIVDVTVTSVNQDPQIRYFLRSVQKP